jgi:hypothetical protein
MSENVQIPMGLLGPDWREVAEATDRWLDGVLDPPIDEPQAS